MKYCVNCGNALEENDILCGRCGLSFRCALLIFYV